MANCDAIIAAIVLYFLSYFCDEGYCTLPLKVSTIRFNGIISNTCSHQCNRDAELNANNEEIQQAIVDNINIFLDKYSILSATCGSTTGWTRVTFLNMSDLNEVCPSNLTLHTSPVRGCGRKTIRAFICDSVLFAVGGQKYSKVCGRVLAYQRASTDAFYNYLLGGQTTIESAYVDGISLTHGPAGSRQHIWTFAAGLFEEDYSYNVRWNCPCTNTQYSWTYQLPSFMGNNYFCDTGNSGPGWTTVTYSADPLWDGEGCGNFSTCCQFNNPPWFHTTLPQTTSDNIELRLCHGESSGEDTIINLIEIYVK